MSDGAPLLSVRDIALQFGGVRALDRVSFDVAPGELFAVIGPNGAGKTSIFNCLNGVYKPFQGTITLEGTSLTGKRPAAIARLGIARTFQNLGLFTNLDIVENLMLGRHHLMRTGFFAGALWWGLARREEVANRVAVERLIDLLELQAHCGRPVGILPYGIQKRIELGRALAMEPKLLLLDEPVAGMNVEETEDMARYILEVRERLGTAMILVEHDMHMVMDLADRVMALDFGVPLATGSPAEIQSDQRVIDAYLGEGIVTMAPAAVDAQGAAATRTVPGLLIEQARVAPNRLALRGKAYGRWVPTTWHEYAEQVAKVAGGLRALGVSDGDRVAIVADNSREWLVADLAVQSLGATSVGLDPSIEEPELQAILVHSGAIVVVAEDEEQYDKLTKIRPDLGALRALVVIDPRGIALDPDDPEVRTLAQVEEAGSDATVDSLATDLARLTPAHVATLIYERGRADGPQEAPVTHADLLSAADVARVALDLDSSTEVLSYLPLSLLAERVISLVTALATGFVVCFGDGGDTFLTDMQQVQPTFFLGVPLVFEEIHSTVERRMQDATFLKRRTYGFWMARGQRHGEARREGRAGIVGRALYGVGWVVLYRPLRVKLGLLRVRNALCTPGTDNPAVIDFFWALGAPVHVDDGGTEDGHPATAGFLHLDRREAQA